MSGLVVFGFCVVGGGGGGGGYGIEVFSYCLRKYVGLREDKAI